MRELTIHELDSQLAESLPDRELMAFYSFNPTAIAVANSGLNYTSQSSVFGDNLANAFNSNTAVAVAANIG